MRNCRANHATDFSARANRFKVPLAVAHHFGATTPKWSLPSGSTASFEAGDIVSQVMGFGSPTPVEIAVMGVNLQDDYTYAHKIQHEAAKLAFLRDLQFAQELNYPTMDININRERAG